MARSHVNKYTSEDAVRYRNYLKGIGVCMACIDGYSDPVGCTDCLGTGWEGGAPAGFVREPRETASAKVVSMRGSKIVLPMEPISGIIELLDRLIGEARSGNMRALGVAYILRPDPVSASLACNSFEIERNTSRDFWYALGKLQRRVGRWIDEI